MKKKAHSKKVQKKSVLPLLLLAFLLVILGVFYQFSPFLSQESKDAGRLHKTAEEMGLKQGAVIIHVPIATRFTITNELNNQTVASQCGGSRLFLLPEGFYRVHFENVNGFITPPDKTFTISPNSTLVIEGNYRILPSDPDLGFNAPPT